MQHLIKVGAALDRVQRACDKLGRGDGLTRVLRDTLTEIRNDLGERKRLLVEHSDALIVLPGGVPPPNIAGAGSP